MGKCSNGKITNLEVAIPLLSKMVAWFFAQLFLEGFGFGIFFEL